MINIHPVQTYHIKPKEKSSIGEAVSLRAYQVYKDLYGEQEAMITGGCRGGFSAGELIAFLYARTFPREQWRDREKQAFKDMSNI